MYYLKKFLKKEGNLAAEVDIPVIDQKEFYAHSQVDQSSGNPSLKGFSFKPENPVFKAFKAPDIKGDIYLRDMDAEYKILNDLATKLGDNPDATGKVRLFTEKDTCASCNQIINQFNEKYPKIEIEVIHNNGVLVIPE